MGECRLNHSREDVAKKLEEQAAFLPSDIALGLQGCLQKSLGQEMLNELFHLLKKYDLAEEAIRQERNETLRSLLQRLSS